MPAPMPFNDDQDATIRAYLADNLSWESLAARVGRPVSSCMDRARAIGARRVYAIVIVVRNDVSDDVSDERQPLPAGDPFTWGAVTRGTVLDGVPYAYSR